MEIVNHNAADLQTLILKRTLSAVLGYQYYQERHKTMEIDIGKGGISIQKN